MPPPSSMLPALMSTTPLAASALTQPFLSRTRSASTLLQLRLLGIFGVLDRRVGRDHKGVPLGVRAGKLGLAHGQIVLNRAQLFIGHGDLARVGAPRRRRQARRRSPRRPPWAGRVSGRRQVGYSAAHPSWWNERVPTSHGAGRPGAGSPQPRAQTVMDMQDALWLGFAGRQHEQAGDLVVVHESERFRRKLVRAGDLGIAWS